MAAGFRLASVPAPVLLSFKASVGRSPMPRAPKRKSHKSSPPRAGSTPVASPPPLRPRASRTLARRHRGRRRLRPRHLSRSTRRPLADPRGTADRSRRAHAVSARPLRDARRHGSPSRSTSSTAILDPVIAVPAGDGKYWSPNGYHRLGAMSSSARKSIVALVVPEAGSRAPHPAAQHREGAQPPRARARGGAAGRGAGRRSTIGRSASSRSSSRRRRS